MSDDDRRDLRHYQLLAEIAAQMRGVTTAALDMAANGQMTDGEALALIRREHDKTEAARKAAWNEYSGRAS